MRQPPTIILILRLMSIILISTIPVLRHHSVQIVVGAVFPSAVWYTMLSFVRSGEIYLQNGSVRIVGNTNAIWARTSASYTSIADSRAYHQASNRNAAGAHDTRWHGFPVRCLVY